MNDGGSGSDVIPVVILNWNGEADTVECLKSIRASAWAGFVPVLVDNGSQAASVERLKQACSSIYKRVVFLNQSDLANLLGGRSTELAERLGEDCMVFVENSQNLGFAKGSNVGIRVAALVGSPWVMLLNNDTVVSPDAFRELRTFLEKNPSVFAVTTQIRYFQPNTRIQNCGGMLTYFGSRKYMYANADAARSSDIAHSIVTFVTGCALLFNHETTGPLTEDFFFGEEDYEFSLRMKDRGLAMACAHRAVVYHKVGTSIAKASTPLGSILVYYACRLLDTRNYYSRLRWHATRALAYLYLPVVLAKNGISARRSLFAARRVQSFIRSHRTMGAAEFRELISVDR